jgi:ATP-binding cassette subfamily B protein
MKAIEGLGGQLTILIIAHRLTTLKGCDRIVQFDKNNLLHVGSYQDMVNASND